MNVVDAETGEVIQLGATPAICMQETPRALGRDELAGSKQFVDKSLAPKQSIRRVQPKSLKPGTATRRQKFAASRTFKDAETKLIATRVTKDMESIHHRGALGSITLDDDEQAAALLAAGAADHAVPPITKKHQQAEEIEMLRKRNLAQVLNAIQIEEEKELGRQELLAKEKFDWRRTQLEATFDRERIMVSISYTFHEARGLTHAHDRHATTSGIYATTLRSRSPQEWASTEC